VTGFKTEDHLFRTVDGIDLSGTLYRPDTNGPIPYVVEVHGGAWRGGDRLNNVDIHADLAKNGIGVFALDFRLSDVSFYPASVEDVNAGVRWFKANADRIDVEASSIGGLASSSGGQQLGMLALRPDDPAYQANDPSLDGVDASIAFFIACWPILDPLARYRLSQELNREGLIEAHHAYFENEDAMRVGNPYLLIKRGEATHLPPMLIIQGTQDGNVAHERADIFAEAYKNAGGKIDVQKFDEPHSFISPEPDSEASKAALAMMRAFVGAQAF
jgi:acetyl esterase/lipase